MRLPVFDLETGGLVPHECGITQMAFGIFDVEDDAITEVAFMHCLLKPMPGRVYEPRALEIQHVTLDQLKEDGIGFGTAVGRVRAIVCEHYGDPKKCAPIAHNGLGFDKPFMDWHCSHFDIAPPFNHCWRDSMDLFRWMQTMGIHTSYKANLDTILAHYGITVSDAERHTARGDVAATAQVIGCMMAELSRGRVAA